MRKAVFLLTLCCILRHVLGAGGESCLDMWCGFDGKEYKFFFHKDTFYEAQKVCQAKEGDLVTIKTSEVYFFLFQHFSRYKKDKPFWVGERLINDKQHYQWVDGETHTDDRYRYTRPRSAHAINNWEGHIGCVQTNDGDRHVVYCYDKASFVCERLGCKPGFKLTNPTTCAGCKPGYKLTNPTTCADIDECNSNHGIGPCHQKCENSVGSYRCLCDEGFIELNKTHCKPVNLVLTKCTIGNGGCQHECHFDPSRNTRKCTCYTGYKAINETNCRDIDECEPNNGGCPKLCHNTAGSFVCREHEPVKCDENNGLCDHTCVANSQGDRTCACKEGYDLVETTRCERIGRAEEHYDSMSWPWILAAACLLVGLASVMLLGLLIWKKRNRDPVQNPQPEKRAGLGGPEEEEEGTEEGTEEGSIDEGTIYYETGNHWSSRFIWNRKPVQNPQPKKRAGRGGPEEEEGTEEGSIDEGTIYYESS